MKRYMRSTATRLAPCALLLLSACASSGPTSNMLSGAPSRPPAEVAGQRFSYQPARDRNLSVTVDKVSVAGDPDFIPQHPNWLQMRLTIRNVGSATPTLVAVKERMKDGTVVAAAQSPSELIKMPNLGGQMATTVGVTTAGMAAGMLINPFLAPIGGLYLVSRTMGRSDRMMSTVSRAQQTGLKAEPLAPGTTLSGDIFLPAVRDQDALIVFYALGGQTQTLVVPRQ